MSALAATAILLLVIASIGAAVAAGRVRRRGLDRWLPQYVVTANSRRRPSRDEPVHVILCIADHYEPQHGKVDPARAASRVESWVREYPRLFEKFRDADGRPPRHTFFFPVDEYDASHVDAIAALCRRGFGEVEIHLHHDNDTPDNLTRTFSDFIALFANKHGLLPHDKRTGRKKFGFVHGNWALDNSLPDGRLCGVNNELDVLREAGCYADFTMPSFPSPTQTRKINSIYYAVDDPHKPRSHDWGVDVGTAPAPANGLMCVQGPLLLNWHRRKFGLVPRVENGNLQGNQPPTEARLDLWLKARVQVPRRPDWFFVKLHTHGATEINQAVVLGEPMVRFHETLARRTKENPQFHFHYVTAREMYNLARAAEAGWTGSVADARDFELVWDPMKCSEKSASAQPAATPALAGGV
jgi:hypothetical protein